MSDDLLAVRRDKLAQLRESGDAYPNDFRPAHSAAGLRDSHADKTREQLADEKLEAQVAGRIMLRRTMGRAMFFTIQDNGVRIQIYAASPPLDEKTFASIGGWDGGDIVGVCGELFKTKTGELTIRATTMRMLVKSLRPLPDKFHGLSDSDARYRRRYLSLLANPGEREVFEKRIRIIRFLRDFFHARDYVEAETPILQPIPGGAAARPFVAHCNALGRDFYLRIAQELYIKRMLVGGFDRVFELNRNFRNEGVSARHNPEFTMLEFNAAYQTCEDFIALTETLIRDLAVHITGGETVRCQGNDISFARPFARLSAAEAILKHCPEYSEAQLRDETFLRERIVKLESESDGGGGALPPTVGELQLRLFEHAAESFLIQPTFLTDYPAGASPLAKRSPRDDDKAERFELFVAGRELVNGFSELNDPDAQAAIFREQAEKKQAGDREAMHYDDDYILALQHGLPPNAGGGIGVDRLTMLLTDSPSIRDVILFPQLRGGDSED